MIIITITGEAGVGKDTVAEYLAENTGWNIIRSYTTRPMREGETNGKEHIFVAESHIVEEDLCAHTVYGGYDYWTAWSQFKQNVPNIYIVDEKGLEDIYLKQKGAKGFELYCIRVHANKHTRLARGVTPERIERDSSRIESKMRFAYNVQVDNNWSTPLLLHLILKHVIRNIKERFSLE